MINLTTEWESANVQFKIYTYILEKKIIREKLGSASFRIRQGDPLLTRKLGSAPVHHIQVHHA